MLIIFILCSPLRVRTDLTNVPVLQKGPRAAHVCILRSAICARLTRAIYACVRCDYRGALTCTCGDACATLLPHLYAPQETVL